MNEEQHQDRVVDLLHLKGFLVFHPRPGRQEKGRGWATPVAFDGKGYYDLTCVHPIRGIVLFVECKGERPRWSVEQKVWRAAAKRAAEENEHVHYWESSPRNWDAFSAWLTAL